MIKKQTDCAMHQVVGTFLCGKTWPETEGKFEHFLIHLEKSRIWNCQLRYRIDSTSRFKEQTNSDMMLTADTVAFSLHLDRFLLQERSRCSKNDIGHVCLTRLSTSFQCLSPLHNWYLAVSIDGSSPEICPRHSRSNLQKYRSPSK